MAYDLWIKNARIADGTGAPAYSGSTSGCARLRRSCFSFFRKPAKLPEKRFIRVQAPSSEGRAGPAGIISRG
jgi:hypothetical protein